VLFVVLISLTTRKFLDGQMVIKIAKKPKSVGEIPFPAVTVCPDVLVPLNFSAIAKDPKGDG
jgi:hypothetical protein